MVQALVAAVGMDPHLARLTAKRGVPAVVARVDALIADEIIASLGDLGVTAFAPAQSHISALPDPFRVKRLEMERPGVFLAEPWRGFATVLHMPGVYLMVRGSLKATETTSQVHSSRGGAMAMTLTMGPAMGAAYALSEGPPSSVRSTRTKMTEILDVYMPTGEMVRFNADKLSFDMLGTEKGYTDRENMIKLTAMLQAMAPHAHFDAEFPSFRCPPEFIKSQWSGFDGSGSRRRTCDAPAFDFYSAWAFLRCKSMSEG